MSPKANISNPRAASPVMAIIAVVAVALALLATLLVAAAPVNAATVGSTSSSMSADAESYKVAPGESIIIKIANMPSTAGLGEVNFEDADGFTADEYFTVTSTEKDFNATVKIVAAEDTPLGDYLVTIVPQTNASQAVEVTLTVEMSLSQIVSGNLTYLGGGIGLIVVGYATNVIKNRTAKRITKPLSVLMYIVGAAMLLWVLYQVIAGAL